MIPVETVSSHLCRTDTDGDDQVWRVSLGADLLHSGSISFEPGNWKSSLHLELSRLT